MLLEVTRPMRHRLAAVVTALAWLALVTVPALAKEGMQARLDAPIPAETPPGTTLEVRWSTFVPDGSGGTVAYGGAPVSIALTEPGASEPATVVQGDEYPSGSGHFTATIVVPPGGIAPDGVSILLRGESCRDGVCQRSDLPFELLGETISISAAPVPSAAGPVAAPSAAAPVAAPTGDGSATDTTPWLPLAAAAVVVVIGAVLVAVRIGRRRATVIATGTLAAVALLLAAAGGVFAKEPGVIATFDPPIPDDATPGTTLELTWSMRIEPTDGSAATMPYEATSLIVRVTSRRGVPVDLPANHLGAGRYEVAFTVPDTGLGALDLGLPTDTGGLLLLGEPFDAAPIIRTVGPAAVPDEEVATSPSLIAGGLAVAIGAGALVLGLSRRRRAGSVLPSTGLAGGPAGSTAGPATPTR